MNNEFEGLSLEQLAGMHYGNNSEAPIEETTEVENTEEPDYNDENTELPTDYEEEPQNSQDLEPTEEDIVDNEEHEEIEEEETLQNQSPLWDVISKPFKANGKMMSVETPEEAIRLMQMGVGSQQVIQEYNKNRPLLKALQDNDLLSEDTINLLIEAKSGKLGAYKNLLSSLGFKEEQFDELQYSEETEEYSPSNHIQSPHLLRFSDGLQNLDVNYPDVADKVKQTLVGFNDNSVELISKEPDTLEFLANLERNGHLEDIISQADKAVVLGYVPQDTPKINIINHIVGAMNEQYGLNIAEVKKEDLAKPQTQTQKTVTTKKTVNRRSASRSPESVVARKRSNSSSDPHEDIYRQIEEASAKGDMETQKALLNTLLNIEL